VTGSPSTVVLFHTSNHAFRAEMLLKRAEIRCKLIPVPRHLSSDCGVCARISTDDKSMATELLEEAKVPIAGIYEL
jgi:hypothetical protein